MMEFVLSNIWTILCVIGIIVVFGPGFVVACYDIPASARAREEYKRITTERNEQARRANEIADRERMREFSREMNVLFMRVMSQTVLNTRVWVAPERVSRSRYRNPDFRIAR